MSQQLREAAELAAAYLETFLAAEAKANSQRLRAALAIPDPPAVEWIDVKVRLPDGKPRYILIMDDTGPAHPHWLRGTISPDDYDATHWAELPKGPEKGGQ